MATATKTKEPATAAAPIPTSPALRAYQLLDAETGDVTARFKYLPGQPKQYRFDAKAGQFNINGTKTVGATLTFVPLALRVFRDDILNMGPKDWAELFFVDDAGHVSAVLFHGYSVENLTRLNRELFYDDVTLTDVQLTATASRKETTKDGKKATYYIAEFSYVPADAAEVATRHEFAADHFIYRDETLTGKAETRLVNGYRLPAHYEQPEAPQLAEALDAASYTDGGDQDARTR